MFNDKQEILLLQLLTIKLFDAKIKCKPNKHGELEK